MDNSFVFIKVSKCGTETVKWLIKNNVKDKNLILDGEYEKIFNYKNKQFKFSVNHINYDNYFINHLDKIMISAYKICRFCKKST